MSSGITQGALDLGAPTAQTGRVGIPVTATPKGELSAKLSDDALAETNRLLRRVILGLEMAFEIEIPEVD